MNKRFLYIDVGDTLIHLRYTVSEMYAAVLFEHGIIKKENTKELHKHFKLAWREVSSNLPVDYADRYHAHPKGYKGWWRDLIDLFLFQIAGKEIQSEEVYELIFAKFDDPKNWVVDPSFFSLLRYLKEKEIGIGIISNWDLRLRELLKNLNLLEYFENVIISAEFGYEKPSLRIFEEGMRLTGLSPESHFYVGDKLDLDYYPAEKLGWTSFWKTDEKNQNLRVIKSLGDLVDYI